MTADSLLFLKRLITSPRRVSAIGPSSRHLARAMAEGLGPHSGPVVEFGPGTGRLTEAILAAGVKPSDLTCLELDAEFAALIRRRFPGVNVVHAGAETAGTYVKTPVCTVISGLPLLSMPLIIRRAIIKAAFDILAPGGRMVQFTYGRNAPLTAEEFDELGLVAEKGPLVKMNLPPARIYFFRRKSE